MQHDISLWAWCVDYKALSRQGQGSLNNDMLCVHMTARHSTYLHKVIIQEAHVCYHKMLPERLLCIEGSAFFSH